MALTLSRCKTCSHLKCFILNLSPNILSRPLRSIYLKKHFKTASAYQDEMVIEFLKASSPEILSQHHLSPLLVQRILITREVKSLDYDDMRTLGFGKAKSITLYRIINNIEHHVDELQNIIKNQSDLKNDLLFNTSENEFENSSKEKKFKKQNIYNFTYPDIRNYDFENINLITGASCTLNHVCVTTVNAKGNIEDMKIIPFFADLNDNSDQYLGNFEICEKVLRVVQQLPKSDLLVFEKTQNFPNRRSNDSTYVNMMQNMILPLTTRWRCEEDSHSTIILKRSLVSKLYDLEIDKERKSFIGIGERMLTGERPFKWMTPMTFSTSSLRNYILATKIEKLNLIESLFVAAAFKSVYVNKVFGDLLNL